jgi:hypothetical protein
VCCVGSANYNTRVLFLGEATKPIPSSWGPELPEGGGKPPPRMDYNAGAQNGPKTGPMMATLACSTIFALWCLLTPLVDLDAWATASNKYATVDKVVAVQYGSGGKTYLRAATKRDPPDKIRTRYKSASYKWRPITRHSLLVFLGILVAMSGMRVRTADMLWGDDYDTYIPWIQNAMTKNSFELHRRFIHFADNTRPNADDKLWKVRPVLNLYQRTIPRLWKFGQFLCIDESMIACKSRAVSFLQYMPVRRAHMEIA